MNGWIDVAVVKDVRGKVGGWVEEAYTGTEFCRNTKTSIPTPPPPLVMAEWLVVIHCASLG